MKRRPSNRYASTGANHLRSVTSDPNRKPRDRNNGEYDGPNRNTSLEDFLRVNHKTPDRPRVED